MRRFPEPGAERGKPMVYGEHKRIYNEIDEIDHLTLRRRKGETFSPARAAALIIRYRALDADVAAALSLSDEDAVEERLAAAAQQTLYDLLVKTRTVLMRKSGLLPADTDL